MSDAIFTGSIGGGAVSAAGDGIRVSVQGFDELDKALRKLPIAVEKRLVGNALRAGAKVAAAGLRVAAPRRSGSGTWKRIGSGRKGYQGAALRAPGYLKRKGIIVRKARKGPNKRLRYFAGPSHAAYYGELVSLGKGGRRGSSGGPGRDWIKRGWNASKQQTLSKLTKNLERGIARETKKLLAGSAAKRSPRG